MSFLAGIGMQVMRGTIRDLWPRPSTRNCVARRRRTSMEIENQTGVARGTRGGAKIQEARLELDIMEWGWSVLCQVVSACSPGWARRM